MAESSDQAESPIFVLAPPFGLGAHLAACLGRHPDFLSLPAIQLMCADSPRDLEARWGQRLRDHDHGLIRAVAGLILAAENPDAAEQAAAWIDARADAASKDILDALASAARPRRLIDASFLYGVDDGALSRIATLYPNARYIHLLRHPKNCFGPAEVARARCDSLWLRPHLRIHAALADRPPVCWIRIRAEWLAADPRPRLTAILQWLGAEHGQSALDRLLDAETHPEFGGRGPGRAPHGVDPALVGDPRLDALFGGPPAPEFDEAAWQANGFDDETRAMARLFGYV